MLKKYHHHQNGVTPVGADHSPPVEGWQPMHFVIHVFSNNVEVLHSVTPIDLLAQSAVLSDGVVVVVLHEPNRSAPPNHGYRKRNG